MYHLDEDPVMQKLITDRFIGFLNEVAKDIDIPPQIFRHHTGESTNSVLFLTRN